MNHLNNYKAQVHLILPKIVDHKACPELMFFVKDSVGKPEFLVVKNPFLVLHKNVLVALIRLFGIKSAKTGHKQKLVIIGQSILVLLYAFQGSQSTQRKNPCKHHLPKIKYQLVKDQYKRRNRLITRRPETEIKKITGKITAFGNQNSYR